MTNLELASRGDTLRVLTYNLHGLLQDGPNPDWDPVRTAWLLDAIEALDPDIVGFQEVLATSGSDGSDNQIRTLADSLTARTGKQWESRFSIAHPSWDRYDEGIAVLTKHEILSSREVILDSTDLYRRNMLTTRIKLPSGVTQFTVTHLAHREAAEAVRVAQVEQILHVLRSEAAEIPSILVGDFNATPDRGPVRRITSGEPKAEFVDAYRAVHPGDNGYTFSADDPERRIDYVFIGGRRQITPVRATVTFDERREGLLLSDHLGVVVDFVASRG